MGTPGLITKKKNRERERKERERERGDVKAKESQRKGEMQIEGSQIIKIIHDKNLTGHSQTVYVCPVIQPQSAVQKKVSPSL